MSGKLPILRERQQALRVAESKCLQRTSKGVRAARKGIGGLLPGAESRSSEVRVSDGMHEPIPEDSLHYCLLLGDGDINDRGEGDEGFNTPVCRPRGVQKTSKRGPSPGQDRACAKTDFFLLAGPPAQCKPCAKRPSLRGGCFCYEWAHGPTGRLQFGRLEIRVRFPVSPLDENLEGSRIRFAGPVC